MYPSYMAEPALCAIMHLHNSLTKEGLSSLGGFVKIARCL